MLSVRQGGAKYINKYKKIQSISRYYLSIYFFRVEANLLGVRVRTQTIAISSNGRDNQWVTLPRSEEITLPLAYCNNKYYLYHYITLEN